MSEQMSKLPVRFRIVGRRYEAGEIPGSWAEKIDEDDDALGQSTAWFVNISSLDELLQIAQENRVTAIIYDEQLWEHDPMLHVNGFID